MNSVLDEAFILQSKPYRESSAIVRLFSQQHGLVSAVIRGVYGDSRKARQLRSAIQTGNRIELQWTGRSDLKTVTSCDLLSSAVFASPRHFVCLCYVNELLLHFLQAEQPAQRLYVAHQYLVQAVAIDSSLERVLRLYEYELLDELGCSVDFLWDAGNDCPVTEGINYMLEPQTGICVNKSGHGLMLQAEHLHKLAERDLASDEMLAMAKQINRRMIDYQLAGRPLKARELYRQL